MKKEEEDEDTYYETVGVPCHTQHKQEATGEEIKCLAYEPCSLQTRMYAEVASQV